MYVLCMIGRYYYSLMPITLCAQACLLLNVLTQSQGRQWTNFCFVWGWTPYKRLPKGLNVYITVTLVKVKKVTFFNTELYQIRVRQKMNVTPTSKDKPYFMKYS